MKAIGALVVFVVGAVSLYAFTGYTVQQLWGWFAVTAFAVPALSLKAAVGLSLLVDFVAKDPFVTRMEVKAESPEMKLVVTFVRAYAYILMVLLIGYLVHVL